MERRWLPGLNSLRAIAAFVVLIWHVDRFSSTYGIESVGYGKTSAAHSAVVFFFVLSGYLITWLLLCEKSKAGVCLASFYRRRALRILPPYLLVLVWSFLLVWSEGESPIDYARQYAFYFLLIPNVANAFNFSIRCLLPLWSIGVEEQFYLVWPFILKRVQAVPRVLGLIFLAYMGLKLGLRVLEGGPVYQLVRLTSVSSLVIGAFAGWMVFTESPLLRRVYSKPVQVFSLIFVVYCIIVEPLQLTSALQEECQAPVFACLILNVSTNPDSLLKMQNPVLSFLGTISYGIYLYHLPMMFTIGGVLGPWLCSFDDSAAIVLANVVTIVLTTAAATVSYFLVERPLLALKPVH